MYSRDTGKGNSREVGGGESSLLSTEGVYSRDTGKGNSREGGGGTSSGVELEKTHLGDALRRAQVSAAGRCAGATPTRGGVHATSQPGYTFM